MPPGDDMKSFLAAAKVRREEREARKDRDDLPTESCVNGLVRRIYKDNSGKSYLVEYDEKYTIYDLDRPLPNVRYIDIPERKSRKETIQEIRNYWNAVGAGIRELEPAISCEYCVWCAPVMRNPDLPGICSHLICENQAVVESGSFKHSVVGEAFLRCSKTQHFAPRGVHVLAEKYLGWKADPVQIEQMKAELHPVRVATPMATPPPVVKKPKARKPSKWGGGKKQNQKSDTPRGAGQAKLM